MGKLKPLALPSPRSSVRTFAVRMLEVRLLGQFDVRRDEAPLLIPSRPAQALFAYLILNAGTTYRREKLAGLLWPDTTEANARSYLRHELWRVRKAIESGAPGRRKYLIVDEITIGFDALAEYWLDAALLEATSPEASASDLIETLSVYRGELLPGFYDEWVLLERERLQAVFEQKMVRLMERLIEEQRWAEAQEWGERWIAQGQTPEPAYRTLMAAHSASGDVAKVSAVYQRAVEALRKDLGVEPSEQTRALYERLVRGGDNADGFAAQARDSALPLSAATGAKVSPPPAPDEVIAPPVSTVAPRWTNLPVPLTSFVGREQGMAEVKRRLALRRLVTLTGAGGSGKTRLAIEVARDGVEEFQDGVWWVELAALSDPTLVPPAVARVLGVREVPNQPLSETLANYLHAKKMLLVWDNCEHLVDACAGLAERLLSACGNLKILATSREALGLTGEQVWPVPTLSLPDAHQLPLPQLYELLTEGERTLFRRLAVFAGGFTLDAAEAVCAGAGVEPVEVLDLLTHLVDKSLVMREGRPEGVAETRYRMLETIGEYGREKLIGAGEAEVLRDRHLRFFSKLAEQAEPLLLTEQVTWFKRLDVEIDNLRAAIEWSMHSSNAEEPDKVESGLLLAGSLTWFLESRARRETSELLKQVLSKPGAKAETIARAKALNALGHLEWSLGNLNEARAALEEALAVGRKLGDKITVAWALPFLGAVADFQGDYATASPFLEEALAISLDLGIVGKNIRGIALGFLGDIPMHYGNFEQARVLYSESIGLLTELQSKNFLTYTLRRLGYTALHQGDYIKANTLFQESLALNQELGHQLGVTACVSALAATIAARGENVQALELFGAVDSSLNIMNSLLFSPDQVEYQRNLAAVRAQLDEATFNAAWARGQAMTLEQAVEFALEKLGK